MVRNEPNFLTEVMDTIASLKDSKGSPPDKILDKIISQRKTPLKNASLHVKKALKTGLKTGLLKEIGGKFKLGLGSKDYAIFKNFRQLDKNSNLPIREIRRRGRRRRRGRSRRRKGRRRRRNDFDLDTLGLGSENVRTFSLLNLSKSSTLPIKELRRRGRRGRRGRRRRSRRRRRGRRRTNLITVDGVEVDDDTNAEPMDRGRRRRRRRGRRRRSRRRGRRRTLEDGDSIASSESKEITSKSSEDKPKSSKSGHGDARNPSEKRDLTPIPPRGRLETERGGSDQCIHTFHHDANHYGHPPHQGNYGGYYD